MKTQVIMKRELFGSEISQQSKTEFFSATDLVKAGNKYRILNNLSPFDLSSYIKNNSFLEFKKEVETKYGTVYVSGNGRGSHTWVHPLIFIDIALAISPKLKLEVYEWLFDSLIKYRNLSGDSYKEMSAALYLNSTNLKEFPKYIASVAEKIKKSICVEDWNTASEKQLKNREDIHKAIKLLCSVLKNNDQAVRLGIQECNKIIN